MSVAKTAWTALSTRAVRVALARGDLDYSSWDASRKMSGLTGTAKSIRNKVDRGSVSLSDFLHLLYSTTSSEDIPCWWPTNVPAQDQLHELSAAIVDVELQRSHLRSEADIAVLMSSSGASVTWREIQSWRSMGHLTLASFLHLLAVVRSDALKDFVRSSELRRALALPSSD